MRRGSGVLLLVYLTALITGTHLPHPEELITLEGNDKWLHFGAYFGLSFLMATRLQTLRPVTWRAIVVIGSLAAVTGIVDELTQMLPGINRQCELADWFADVAGAACGLLIWLGLRRLFGASCSSD
jgi:VanZ family protein